jgi:glyoxylase-like metal-dependent hydrolase (beta-lactamase superfamily II)
MPELHRLKENVYGVTRLFHPAGPFGVNAGFLIGRDVIVHIDAGMTVRDGEWLLSQSQKEADKGNARLLLILTHHHSDHIFGMRVFKEKEAEVIAHRNLQDFLSHSHPPLHGPLLETYKPFILNLMVESFSYKRAQAEQTIGDVRLFLPDTVFSEDMELQVNDEKLILLYTPGHVPSEVSVYHPSSKTLFAGDTIYEGMPLTTRFGGPKEWKQWIKSLEKLQQLDINKIVPGHGKICGKEEIQRNIEYLERHLTQY